MPITKNEWDVFLRGQIARYQPRLYSLLMANMSLVASAIQNEDNPESVLVRLGSILRVQGIADALLSLYISVGLNWAVQMRRSSNRDAKANDRLNRDKVKEAIRRDMQVSAIKNAHEIIRTQKKQVRNIIVQRKEQGQAKDQIAAAIKINPHAVTQSVLIAHTEVPAAANKGAIISADQSEYVYLKKWVSQHDDLVRYPGNGTYRSLGYPNPKFDHQSVDGQILPLDQPFLDTLGYIMYPGDTDADIANRARCRCRLETVLQVDSLGRPIKKNGVTILMPRTRLGQQSSTGGVTIIQPEPNITVIQPGELPKRPIITI